MLKLGPKIKDILNLFYWKVLVGTRLYDIIYVRLRLEFINYLDNNGIYAKTLIKPAISTFSKPLSLR